MKRLLVVLLAFLWNALAFTSELAPVRAYSVLLPKQPTQMETYSGELLQRHLKEATGQAPAVVTEPERPSGPVISIGDTALARERGLQGIPSEHGYEVAVRGQDVFLRGGRPGLLYGAVSLLEEDLGFRWYAEPYANSNGPSDPGQSLIPDLRTHPLKVQERRYTPPFRIREVMFMYGTQANEEMTLHLRLAPISYHSWLPEASGCRLNSHLFIHTYSGLLPSSKYYAEHPEYYALQKGERVRQSNTFGTVCYTNPDVSRIMAENLRREMAREPQARYFSVSANDSGADRCECPNCAPVIAKVGRPGIQLMLANRVAEELPRTGADLLLTTLVYGSGQLTLGGVKCHPNVAPFLAPIGSRFNEVRMLVPLKEIPDIARLVAECSGAKTIFWDYLDSTNLPFPTFDQFASSIRWLAQSGVYGYFADCTTGGVSLQPLKKWVYAHLLWNPNADWEALASEFTTAYYGAATPEITAYISLMRGAWRRFKKAYDQSGGDGAFLKYTADEWREMQRLLENAMAKAGSDEVLKGRIAREYLVVLTKLLSGNPRVVGQEEYMQDLRKAEALWTYLPDKSQLRSSKLRERWRRKSEYSSQPSDPRQYSSGSVLVYQPLVVNGMSEYLPDPKAFQGKASRHRGGRPWGIQWKYFSFLDRLLPDHTYVLRLRARAEVKQPYQPGREMFVLRAFNHGEEGRNHSNPMLAGHFSADDQTGLYRWHLLGKLHLSNPDATGMLWMDSLVGNDEAVWYDCLEFIPAEEYPDADKISKTIAL